MAKNINLAISEEKLAKLILAGELCAADIKCLDKESKQAVWRLCLWCCAKRTSCQHCQKPCELRATDDAETLLTFTPTDDSRWR